jgi:hypothetical protein
MWSWDLVADQTENGRSFRILTLIDEHTRLFWKTRIVLIAREALLLRGSDDNSVPDQGCCAVVIERRNTENRSGAHFTLSVLITCAN